MGVKFIFMVMFISLGIGTLGLKQLSCNNTDMDVENGNSNGKNLFVNERKKCFFADFITDKRTIIVRESIVESISNELSQSSSGIRYSKIVKMS